jgi:hypothetical protein
MPSTTNHSSPNGKIKINQNRKFGFMLSSFFLFLFVFNSPILLSYPFIGFYLFFSIIFGLIAWVRPDLLSPLLKKWIKLGELMGKFVSPIVLGAIFLY